MRWSSTSCLTAGSLRDHGQRLRGLLQWWRMVGEGEGGERRESGGKEEGEGRRKRGEEERERRGEGSRRGE